MADQYADTTDDMEAAICLIDYATDLAQQCSQSGQNAALETAISLLREACANLPANHLDQLRGSMTLGNALMLRFCESGQREDANEAISLYRDLPHPDRLNSLHNLAHALSACFNFSGRREDLDQTILWYQEVLHLVHASHPRR